MADNQVSRVKMLANRLLHELRLSIPPGHVIGRTGTGDGPPGLIKIDDLVSGKKVGAATPIPGSANPTATASDVAVNGSATTFMRSDGAPAVQKASASQFGLVKVDGTTITATGGVISSSGGSAPTPLAITNPGAETGDTTGWTSTTGTLGVLGSPTLPHTGSYYFTGGSGNATTIAHQDIAVPTGLESAVDAGTISADLSWWQNSFAGNDQGKMQLQFFDGSMVQQGSTVNGVLAAPVSWTNYSLASTVVPATTRTLRIIQVMVRNAGAYNDAYIDDISLSLSGADPLSNTLGSGNIFVGDAGGIAQGVAMSGDATISNAGVVTVPKTSSSLFGIAKVDGTTITATGGVISSVPVSGANPTATASDVAVNGSATTYMRSDGAPAVQKASSSQFGIAKVDGTTIAATGGVVSTVSVTNSAFSAYRSSPLVAATTAGVEYAYVCNGTFFDVGGDFSTSTGKFTAPVAGYYMFRLTVLLYDLTSAMTSGWCDLLVTDSGGTTVQNNFHESRNPYAIRRADGYVSLEGGDIVFLTAGYKVFPQVRINGAGGASLYGASAQALTSFSGSFLHDGTRRP